MTVGWRTGNPPEKDETYLVQLAGGGYAIGRWCNFNRFWPQLTTDHWYWVGLPQYSKAVAWMVLPEPLKVGEWEKSDIPGEEWKCSSCGGAAWMYDYRGIVKKSRYCPNCGAWMIDDSVEDSSHPFADDVMMEDGKDECEKAIDTLKANYNNFSEELKGIVDKAIEATEHLI